MKTIRYLVRILFRFVILWLVDAISLLITATVVPGISLYAVEETPRLVVAAAAALVIGAVNLTLRPLLLLFARPLGPIILIVIGFFLNAIFLVIASFLLPGFDVLNPVAAFLGGLILALINTAITSILTIDDEDSFFQGMVERLAAQQPFTATRKSNRGLILIEIDGLSYWHMRRALSEGRMPTVNDMINNGEFSLTHFDCGLPSQTSACQAGIMYGDSYNIPSFRWYEKRSRRLIVSGRDAAEINTRFSKGRGLLRGGTSINNMLTGDAEKSMLTLANLTGGDAVERRRRAQDIYLMLLDPYFFMRTLILFFGDIFLELWQNFRARVRNVQPRLNRLSIYPLLRAACTVLMRDIAAYLLVLDIIRGSPVIYMTWPGYDEVAHHSGPWSSDAFDVLQKFDRVIARVRNVIQRKAPITYDFFILSDHGQSFGATFKQRYGESLEQLLRGWLPTGTDVVQTFGGDDGTLSLAALAGEIRNIQEQGIAGRVGRNVVGRAGRAVENSTRHGQGDNRVNQAAAVVVCGSGNLAQVYFDHDPRRLTISEIHQAYPGMLDALTNHPGIGFVVAYDDTYTPLALSHAGVRNLHSGEVRGLDPLAPFGTIDIRAWQVRRLAEFPDSGDIIVNSTLYPDGSVAAMEELIGNHGGLGGEQTDAFLVHPSDMTIPPTYSAADLFSILDARRRNPPAGPALRRVPAPVDVDPWEPRNLFRGLFKFQQWVPLAVRSLWLDRTAFAELKKDHFMTGPAVFIAFLAALVLQFTSQESNWRMFFARLAGFVTTAIFAFMIMRLLGANGSFAHTLRVLGFAQVPFLFDLLVFIPQVSPAARLIVVVLAFVAMWLGLEEAHPVHGLRHLAFPLLSAFSLILGLVWIPAMISGTTLTAVLLVQSLGFYWRSHSRGAY